jgi:hypothetical protein
MRSFVKSGRIIFLDNTIISSQNAIFLDNVRKKRKLMFPAGRLIFEDPSGLETSGILQALGRQNSDKLCVPLPRTHGKSPNCRSSKSALCVFDIYWVFFIDEKYQNMFLAVV